MHFLFNGLSGFIVLGKVASSSLRYNIAAINKLHVTLLFYLKRNVLLHFRVTKNYIKTQNFDSLWMV